MIEPNLLPNLIRAEDVAEGFRTAKRALAELRDLDATLVLEPRKKANDALPSFAELVFGAIPITDS
jgi:hypothetical protein